MVKPSTILLALVQSGFSQAASSQKLWTFAEIPPSTSLKWYPCETDNFFCANLDVPLDYAKPKGYRATVPFMKYSADPKSTFGPYRGVLLGNPGGPGEVSIKSFIPIAAELSNIVGTNYDLVAFDNRGIGYSLPLANCSTGVSSSSINEPKSNQAPPKNNKAIPEFANVFYEDDLILAQAIGKACEAQIGGPSGAGQHMSTATNARDIISFLDAFGETPHGKTLQAPIKFNYWGFSYGTVLGMTFANMFPSRVGRVILDGIVDPVDYMNGRGFDSITKADIAIDTFFDYCQAAGPASCSYYTGKSADDIQARFNNFIMKLNSQEAYANNWLNASVIEYALETVKSILFTSSYEPITSYPPLASQLVSLELALKDLSIASINAAVPTSTGIPVEWYSGVACSDNRGVFYNKNLQQLQPEINTSQGQSVFAGELWAVNRVSCSGWPIKAVETYTGSFGGANTPMLFVSNTYDPVTPIGNGQKWSQLYRGSKMLTVDGVGHTSLYTANNCAYLQIQTYLQTGTITQTYCSQEPGAFGVTINSIDQGTTTGNKRAEFKAKRSEKKFIA